MLSLTDILSLKVDNVLSLDILSIRADSVLYQKLCCRNNSNNYN